MQAYTYDGEIAVLIYKIATFVCIFNESHTYTWLGLYHDYIKIGICIHTIIYPPVKIPD